jgi:hypothetical protein
MVVMMHRTVSFVAALWVVGCGARQPAPAPASTSAPASAPASATPPASASPSTSQQVDRPWSQLDHRERMHVMKQRVLPLARTLFRELDAERYAHVDCTTCHGDRALDGDYSMPNPALLPLAFGPGSGYAELKRQHPQMIAFMKDKLSPGVGDVLGLSKWSDDNPEGFGCWSCHPRKPDASHAP